MSDKMINELFQFLKHGDDAHQEWLYRAIKAFFYKAPRPCPK